MPVPRVPAPKADPSAVGPPSIAAASSGTAAAVLDTNAVLDWLVFRHPSCHPWTHWFAQGSVRWLCTNPMRNELAHVLARGVGGAWQPDQPRIWATWDALAMSVSAPVPAGPGARVRCTDPDDQKFIDLALDQGARWLVSRDRAVLKLSRRVRPLGLRIVTPEAWTAELSAR